MTVAVQPKTYRPWATLGKAKRFWSVFDAIKDNPQITNDEAFGIMVERHGREVPFNHIRLAIAQLRERRLVIEVDRGNRIGWEVKPKNG
jgi:hypothetical protein